ncbi:MAG: hypothetical protein ACHP65_07555 [Legionellales bacterium]
MALITCSACHQQYSETLDACFHCGEPKPVIQATITPFLDKTSSAPSSQPEPSAASKSSGLKVFLISALICLVIGVLLMIAIPSYNNYLARTKSAEDNQAVAQPAETNTAPKPITEEDFNDPTLPFLNNEAVYRQAMFGDFQTDQKLVVQGKVTQVVGDGTYRVSTGKLDLGIYSNDTQYFNRDIMVTFNGTPRVLEGDLIGIKGRYNGTEEYETILHTKVKVPVVVADFYSTNDLSQFFAGRNAAIEAINNAQALAQQQAQAAQDAAVAAAAQKDADDKAEQQYQLDATTLESKKTEMNTLWNAMPVELQRQLLDDQKNWLATQKADCLSRPDKFAVMKCKLDAVDSRLTYLTNQKDNFVPAPQAPQSYQQPAYPKPINPLNDTRPINPLNDTRPLR